MSSAVFAQTEIAGSVKDEKGNAIVAASISIKDSYDGTISDSAGQFLFSTFETGMQLFVVTATGYENFEQAVDLSKPQKPFQVVLKSSFNEMTAVVITAGSFEASDKKRATVLNAIDIATTASANADITAAIKTLPGAQQVGESEGLFVRGGTAAETKTYIDGTLVNNFFYSSVPDIAQRGRFSPFIFKGTIFSAGGYSALYGQALSSALILESIDLPEQSASNIGISPIGVSLGFQKLNKKKTASWGLNYGYTNLYLAFKLLKTKQDFFTIPAYHTGDANFRIKTSSTGMLKYYGYFSQNKLAFRQASLDTLNYKEAFHLKNFNMYHNLSWKENLGEFWKVQLGASFANNKDDIIGGLQDADNNNVLLEGMSYKIFALNSNGNYVNGKAVFERRLRGLSALRFGTEYNYSNDKNIYTAQTADRYSGIIKEHLSSLFAETDLYVTNNLAARFGGRMEHSSLLQRYNFAPRASLAYKVGKQAQASLAYGIFYQSPERKYLPAIADLNFAKATHYIAQYQKLNRQTTFRVEAFYKKYENLLKTSGNNYQQAASSNNGHGYAQGVELFWRDRKTIKNVDYWISYSFLDSKRDFLNYPAELQPSFAAKHTFNVVAKKFVSSLRTNFNANYTYASGRPYYNIQYNQSNDKFTIADQGITKDYHSLSLSVNYLPNVFKKGAAQHTVFVFSITNVLGSNQVFGYNYSDNGLRKQAIEPSTRTFIYLGAFISFGIDRTQDIINSNL